MDILLAEVREVKADVKDLVKQGAIHNTLLREHERRSLALEARIIPLETSSAITARLRSFTKALLLVTVGALIKHFLSA